MGKQTGRTVFAAVLALIAACTGLGRAGAVEPQYSFSVKTAMDTVSRWPETSRGTAMEMIGKYGAPDGITRDVVYWKNRGGWLEIKVRKTGALHNFPLPHEDVIEQVVAYEVPPGRYDDIAVFNGSVLPDRTRGTISARCRSEAMNYAALNIAHDLITKGLSVEAARESLAAIVREHAEGKKHRYTEGLQFIAENPEVTRDPDFAF